MTFRGITQQILQYLQQSMSLWLYNLAAYNCDRVSV